jgi:glycosyltransferase involved in cell wall biosynthesis
MAAYNGERYIADQLRSILDQLADGDEVVVMDDASRDRTVSIIEALRDKRVRVIRSSDNRGVVNSFERAIMEAKGDIIFLSDQDDLWKPEKVQRILQAFDDPAITLVQSDANVIDADGNITAESFCKTRGGFVPGVILNIVRCHYLGCAMAFRRQILSRCMPFPRNIPMHDIWIGIVNAYFGKTAYVDEPLVQYRRHGENISRSGSLLRRILWRVNLLVNIAKVIL